MINLKNSGDGQNHIHPSLYVEFIQIRAVGAYLILGTLRVGAHSRW